VRPRRAVVVDNQPHPLAVRRAAAAARLSMGHKIILLGSSVLYKYGSSLM
jgi:hypothetical protein